MQRSLLLLLLLFHWQLNAQVAGDVILSWDFANGIPDAWENGSESGIGTWEYRGVDTQPDLNTASLGSCGGSSVPITSESASNGWVIFDSNYWDDPIGPCGNLGSGEDPGPHTAWLITESLDFSELSTAVLTFQQQFRHNQATTSVQVSIDGGENWTTVYENPGDFATSSSGEWASANLSGAAGGESNVKIKFEFDGSYYWWMLDDIYIYVPNDNDLSIQDESYTLYDGTLTPSGFGDMEYSAWPGFWAPQFNFAARINNVGGLTQTGVSMNVRVTNAADEFVFSENTPSTTLTPGESALFDLGPSYTPEATPDEYMIRWRAEQNEEEESPEDNEVTSRFNITEYTFAHDQGVVDDIYTPAGIYADVQSEIGNLFVPVDDGYRFHSIGVALGEGTTVGSEIYGIVYDFNLDNIVGQTAPYEVNSWDVNSIGENKFVHLELENDILLTEDDSLIAVMVGAVSEDTDLRIARSGLAQNQAGIISSSEINSLSYLLRSPMVRMHVFEPLSVPGCLDPEAMNFEPEADTDDGSCRYPGCTDEEASNYNAEANFNDGSCNFVGCTDPEADNFDPNATEDDGSCEYLGCTDVNANNYEVNANVDDGSCVYNEAFLSADVLSGCAPLTVNFSNQTDVVANGSCTFVISPLNETVSSCVDDFQFTFDTPGSYEVTYTYTVGEFESVFTLGPIEVYALPETPSFTFDDVDNTLSCIGCEGAFEVIWYLNDQVYEIGASEISIIDNGNYAVEILNSNGCSSISEETFIIITNVQEYAAVQPVWVYPNPTRGILNVQSELPVTQVQLMDNSGRVVWQFKNDSGIQQIDVSHIASGNYVLRMTYANQLAIQRIAVY